MAAAEKVFSLCMALLDELRGPDGGARWSDTASYEKRTPGILNVLSWECQPYSSAERQEVSDLSGELGLDEAICEGVLPYGLAAQLLLEEYPVAAAWFRQRYREALASVFPASGEDITRLYGSLEHCGFSRW